MQRLAQSSQAVASRLANGYASRNECLDIGMIQLLQEEYLEIDARMRQLDQKRQSSEELLNGLMAELIRLKARVQSYETRDKELTRMIVNTHFTRFIESLPAINKRRGEND